MIYATPNRGRGGAGAKGILQGMIAGQQARESDQRIQGVQTQLDNQRTDRAKLEFNEAMYNMELGGSPEGVNSVMAKYPDLYLDKNPVFAEYQNDLIPFNDMKDAPFESWNRDANEYLTTKFKRLNSQELADQYGKPYNEDGTINMKHLNKLRELRPDRPITEEMFADPQRYQEYINKGYVMEEQDKDGKFSNTLMTPEMFEAGSANYASYKRKRLQDEALTKAKLDNTSKTKDSAYMQVFNKWQNETDTTKKATLKQQLDQLSLDKPTELTSLMAMRDELPLTPENAAKHKNINDRIHKITQYKDPVEPSAIRTARWEEEQRINQAKTTADYIKDGFNIDDPLVDKDISIEAVNRSKPELRKQVEKIEAEAIKDSQSIKAMGPLIDLLDNPAYDTGYFDNFINWAKGVTPDAIASKSAEQIATEAGIAIESAQRLKDISGASASEEEFQRTLKGMFGTDDLQPSERIAVARGYVTQLKAKLRVKAQQVANQGFPQSAKNIVGFDQQRFDSKIDQRVKKQKADDDLSLEEW